MNQAYKTLKFAVIGDVHGHFEWLAEVLNILKHHENIQIAFQVGDLGFISSERYEYLQILTTGNAQNKPFIYEGFGNINETLAFLQGEITLPLPVFFVGGNHEDWLFLEKLQKEADERKLKSPYFVASNLYFLGRAGIIKIMGIQVGYLSGICEEPGYKSSFSLFSAHLIKEEDLKNLFNQKLLLIYFFFTKDLNAI